MKTNIKLFHVIVDLGMASRLTLGVYGTDLELAFRPMQFWKESGHNEKHITNSHIAYITELGTVTQLTLGGNGSIWEYMRPNAAYKQ